MIRVAHFILLRLLPVITLVLVIVKVGSCREDLAPTPRQIADDFFREAGIMKGWRGREAETTVATGRDSNAQRLFADVAVELGIDMVHDNGARGQYFLMEIMGSGAAFLDVDGDGDLDVFVAGGGPFDDAGGGQPCRLYRNDGIGFQDVTEATGAGMAGPAFGVACADYDNDGDVDIYVTRYGRNALLRNDQSEQGFTFTEVAASAGVADDGLGASAAFFDYDRDGNLDLYVTNYVVASPTSTSPCRSVLGFPDYCPPTVYPPAADKLYRNLGDGRFEDVSELAGIASKAGYGLGVVASDFDDDGWIDLYVANDQSPAFLWRNTGTGTFENVAVLTGSAYDGQGVAIAGMGIAAEDFNADGSIDLLVTNIRNQSHLILKNDHGFFTDVSLAMGIVPPSTAMTGFGVAVFDQDHDGSFDAFFANGKVGLDTTNEESNNPYAQPDQFLRLIDGRFRDHSAAIGIDLTDVGRGVATGDFDNDGDLDLLLTNNGGPVRLLRNLNDSANNWLIVDARTGPRGRAAIGARVAVTVQGTTTIRDIRAHHSYLSSSDPRGHFGLGTARQVDTLVIDWPDGRRSVRTNVPVNQVLRITQEPESPEPAS